MKSKIDLKQLGYEIEHMNRWDEIYLFLRENLTKVDHWKQKARGNPIKGHSMIGKNNGKSF
jgi:hypothetical protein